ncbi:hypothetical protein [uncultured Demequina sp.]|uniref:hypothetical protein n=1 Tax=uncultured Demequina sp. TaxID=693499 RepID=UPI0025DC530E|nr:hypothetical protein [uncultured Demequina sp.]
MTETTTTPAAAPARPGLVTFVGILVYIQAFAYLAFAILWFIGAVSDSVADALGQSDTTVIVLVGVLELLFSLFFFAIAGGLMKGSPGARLWITIAAGARIVIGGIMTVGAFTDGVDNTGHGLLSILLPVAVLFVVWGTDKGQAFFERK